MIMDQVFQNNIEEYNDIGICKQHNRLFQCYCTQCNCIICPSCLMFDLHKGHSVSKIEEGSKLLRQKITQFSKEGLLKFQKTQNLLLDIRHAKLKIQENRMATIQDVQSSFDKLINTLKQRKNHFIEQLTQHYDKEIHILQQKQAKWINKQQRAQKILQYQKSNDELKLVQNAQFIVESLNDMRTPPQKQVISLIDKPKTSIVVGNQIVQLEELIEILRTCMSWSVASTNQIKV